MHVFVQEIRFEARSRVGGISPQHQVLGFGTFLPLAVIKRYRASGESFMVFGRRS